MKNRIIVIGSDHHNTLGVIRSLAYKGINPYVILITISKSPFVLKSKYIHEYSILKSNTDGILFLKQNFKEEKLKPIIISTSDAITSLLDLEYNNLKDYFILPTSNKQGYITKYMNKETLSIEARRCGFNVPLSCIVSSNDVKDIILDYPCITKSIATIEGGKKDIAVLHSKVDLEHFFQNPNHSRQIQIQKFVEKEYEFQFIGLSLNSGREVIIPGKTRIVRNVINNTSFLKYSKLDDSYNELIEKCKVILQNIGYSGLFSAEFLRGNDGNDYFMEINFRNDGNAICVTQAGINLPYIWYLYNIGDDYKRELQSSSFKEVYLMPEFDYLMAMLKGEIRFKDWVVDTFKKTHNITFSYKDPMPSIQLWWNFLCTRIKKIKK